MFLLPCSFRDVKRLYIIQLSDLDIGVGQIVGQIVGLARNLYHWTSNLCAHKDRGRGPSHDTIA